jgi:hypothetical protein
MAERILPWAMKRSALRIAFDRSNVIIQTLARKRAAHPEDLS